MVLAACLAFVALSFPDKLTIAVLPEPTSIDCQFDQRYETQALLGRAGYWPGVVTPLDHNQGEDQFQDVLRQGSVRRGGG
jgi:hypothetical protein